MSNINNVSPGEIFSHPTPMNIIIITTTIKDKARSLLELQCAANQKRGQVRVEKGTIEKNTEFDHILTIFSYCCASGALLYWDQVHNLRSSSSGTWARGLLRNKDAPNHLSAETLSFRHVSDIVIQVVDLVVLRLRYWFFY